MSTRDDQSDKAVVVTTKRQWNVFAKLRKMGNKRLLFLAAVLVLVIVGVGGWFLWEHYHPLKQTVNVARITKPADEQVQERIKQANEATGLDTDQEIKVKTDAAASYMSSFQYAKAAAALEQLAKNMPEVEQNQYYLVKLFSAYAQIPDETHAKETAKKIVTLSQQGKDYKQYARGWQIKSIESLGS